MVIQAKQTDRRPFVTQTPRRGEALSECEHQGRGGATVRVAWDPTVPGIMPLQTD